MLEQVYAFLEERRMTQHPQDVVRGLLPNPMLVVMIGDEIAGKVDQLVREMDGRWINAQNTVRYLRIGHAPLDNQNRRVLDVVIHPDMDQRTLIWTLNSAAQQCITMLHGVAGVDMTTMYVHTIVQLEDDAAWIVSDFSQILRANCVVADVRAYVNRLFLLLPANISEGQMARATAMVAGEWNKPIVGAPLYMIDPQSEPRNLADHWLSGTKNFDHVVLLDQKDSLGFMYDEGGARLKLMADLCDPLGQPPFDLIPSGSAVTASGTPTCVAKDFLLMMAWRMTHRAMLANLFGEKLQRGDMALTQALKVQAATYVHQLEEDAAQRVLPRMDRFSLYSKEALKQTRRLRAEEREAPVFARALRTKFQYLISEWDKRGLAAETINLIQRQTDVKVLSELADDTGCLKVDVEQMPEQSMQNSKKDSVEQLRSEIVAKVYSPMARQKIREKSETFAAEVAVQCRTQCRRLEKMQQTMQGLNDEIELDYQTSKAIWDHLGRAALDLEARMKADLTEGFINGYYVALADSPDGTLKDVMTYLYNGLCVKYENEPVTTTDRPRVCCRLSMGLMNAETNTVKGVLQAGAGKGSTISLYRIPADNDDYVPHVTVLSMLL